VWCAGNGHELQMQKGEHCGCCRHVGVVQQQEHDGRAVGVAALAQKQLNQSNARSDN